MNITRPEQMMQRWNVIQHELLPELKDEVGELKPKLEKVVYTLEWVRIEEFVTSSWCGVGRPPHERAWLANAFVAKAVIGVTTTTGRIERLTIDRARRRIGGFPLSKEWPSEATFSRAFDEFAEGCLAERVHEARIKDCLGDQRIGHIRRAGTAIIAREHPAPVKIKVKALPKRRGRPRRDEIRAPAKESPIKRQRQQTLAQIIEELPTLCDRCAKCNAQGYKNGWNGYKLHIDTADCGVPISVRLSSASRHDSLAAIPLSRITQQRVTNLYDVMDAAYCSFELHEHSRSLNHIPLIDHNPRRGLKEEFEPADAIRYNERTVAERTNARLKDAFGGNTLRVKGDIKVMSHLMFGLLALSADQLMRLRE